MQEEGEHAMVERHPGFIRWKIRLAAGVVISLYALWATFFCLDAYAQVSLPMDLSNGKNQTRKGIDFSMLCPRVFSD